MLKIDRSYRRIEIMNDVLSVNLCNRAEQIHAHRGGSLDNCRGLVACTVGSAHGVDASSCAYRLERVREITGSLRDADSLAAW